MSSPEGRPLSLHAHLALMLAIGLGLTLATGFLGLHHIVRNQLYDAARARVEARMQALAEFAKNSNDPAAGADSMLQFRGPPHGRYFEVRDAEGRILARSASSAGHDLPPPPDEQRGDVIAYTLRLPDGHSGLAVQGSFELPAGDPRGRLIVTVAEETEQLEALEQRIHRAMLLVAVFSVVAGFAAATIAIRNALRPLDRLASLAESIDPDGPRIELDVGGLPRELVVPEQKLSQLLRRVFDSRDRERRFTRVVAHELRTPLAEMRMIADVGVMSQSCEQARAALQNVAAASAELQEIVSALLALARYESGQESPQPEPVDLAAEVRHQLDSLACKIVERRITIQPDLPRSRWVIVDAGMLRRLLANLVGNAVAHAPRDSTVWVSLAGAGPLRIRNQAPHLRSENVPHLGERFYQVATGERNGESHAGLGLPLAAALARVSQLQLSLDLDEEGVFHTVVSGFRNLGASAAIAEPGH